MLPGHGYSSGRVNGQRIGGPEGAGRRPRTSRGRTRRATGSPRVARAAAECELDHLQAVVQVLAEGAGPHHRLEVAVRGGQHAHIDLDRTVAAEARELAVLQHVQQLGLEGRRHVADLVEHHRALLRELELADARLPGAGEGAAFVAEQLAFQQVRRQRRAVHLHERPGPSRRPPVHLAGDHVLADAAFAPQQHADVAVGDAVHHGQHRLHRGAGRPRDLRARRILGGVGAQARHFGAQRLAFECVADGGLERHLADAVGVAGLQHVVGRAEPHGLDDRRRRLTARQHDHLRRRPSLADRA